MNLPEIVKLIFEIGFVAALIIIFVVYLKKLKTELEKKNEYNKGRVQ